MQTFLSMSVKITSTLSCLLPSPTTCQNCRGRNLTCGVVLPKLPLVSTSSGLGNGLRTPPVDDMSTAYQPAMSTYEGHTLSGYPSALSHSSHIKPVVDDARSSHQYRYSSQQVQLRNGPYLSTEPAADPMLRQPPSSLTPVTESSVTAKRSHSTTPRRGSETLIYHSLQMPKCISHTGGNLSDFAAQVGCILLDPRLRVQTMTGVLTRIGGPSQMTCLFWFESIDELKKAESIRSRQPNASIQRLPALAKPHEQFRKWVYNVLSTTQVTQNVILLALLFIYRLKMSTPQIKGRAGSEYRLLTVALMLGNKCMCN